MSETVLTEAKRKQLLEAYLQMRPESFPAATQSAAAPRRDNSALPLTFAQQQLWLHAQLAPDTSLYNEPLTVRRNGPLDVSALERSFTEIVRRHEAWRSTFHVADGEPVQRVEAPFEIKLPLVTCATCLGRSGRRSSSHSSRGRSPALRLSARPALQD